jgi:hypothetical protein
VRVCKILLLVLIVMLSAAGTAHGQLNGLHLKGDAGLDSGSQAPPGAYWGTVFHWYDTGRINNQSGDQVNSTGDLNLFAGLPLVSVVTKRKFLAANYGFMVIPAAVANSSLDAPRFGQNPGAGFGDTSISLRTDGDGRASPQESAAPGRHDVDQAGR